MHLLYKKEKSMKIFAILIFIVAALVVYELWASNQEYFFTQKMNVTYSKPENEPKEFFARMDEVKQTVKQLNLYNGEFEGKRFKLSCVNDKNIYTIIVPHEELSKYLESKVNKSITMRIKNYGYYSLIQSGYFISRLDEEKVGSFLTYHHKSAFCPDSMKSKI
jgi:hypothetical protein